MIFTDTHTHLYDEQLTVDVGNIERAIAAGVTKLYIPNCDSETIAGLLEISDKWQDNCFPMMGLHPTYVKEHYEHELAIVEDWLKKRKFYGVGEIGLDYYWDMTYKNEQIIAFERQIDLALAYDLPIIIHSREAMTDSLNIVRKKQNGKLKGIFHCFSGNLEEAKEVVDLGLYIGVGGVITYRKSTHVVKEIGLEHIVLETDAPYLAPVPYRGKRNESAYIPVIAAKIAEVKQISIEEVAFVTTQNAEKIFTN